MASAALKIEAEDGTNIPGDGEQVDDGSQTGVRDYDAEAREHGWRPKDEFPGDPAKWVDAEAFMKRADDVMPLLKAQNARLKRDFDALKKDLRRATAHFEGAEKRAYEKAKSELEQRVETAIETGDVEAGKAALKEIGELKPVEAERGSPEALKQEADEAFDAFREEHPWYDRGYLGGATEVEMNGRAYFGRMVDKHIAKTKDLPPTEFFEMITEMTLEKYPALKAKAVRQKPSSAVEGGTSGRGGRGVTKTWDNIPEAARRQYERYQSRGILGVKPSGDSEKDLAASRAYYAKSHDWEGYTQ